jgi:hypothetical protein
MDQRHVGSSRGTIPACLDQLLKKFGPVGSPPSSSKEGVKFVGEARFQFRPNQEIEAFAVIMVIPLLMNIFQFWVVDYFMMGRFVKEGSATAAG